MSCLTQEHKRALLAEAAGQKLFVIHKPIHDPFGYYRENGAGYTTLTDAWKVTEEVGKRYVNGTPTQNDRVVLEPAALPDYFGSLDAVHQLELWIKKDPSPAYYIYRDRLIYAPGLGPCAEASERAEILGQVLALWKEGE